MHYELRVTADSLDELRDILNKLSGVQAKIIKTDKVEVTVQPSKVDMEPLEEIPALLKRGRKKKDALPEVPVDLKVGASNVPEDLKVAEPEFEGESKVMQTADGVIVADDSLTEEQIGDVSYEQVKQAVLTLANTNLYGADAMKNTRELLAEFSVKRAQELTKDQYGAFMKRANEILANKSPSLE